MASGIASDLSWYQKLHVGKKCASKALSSQIITCFFTNTRTTHTRQNKPYRLGAAPEGVVGARAAAVQQRRCPQLAYPLAVSAAVLLKENKIKSSTEKQSSAIIVHKPKRTVSSTRTTHTRQNKPYRLGASPAGVVGARGRCFPAATVPAAVVFACGVCCCISVFAIKVFKPKFTKKIPPKELN